LLPAEIASITFAQRDFVDHSQFEINVQHVARANQFSMS